MKSMLTVLIAILSGFCFIHAQEVKKLAGTDASNITKIGGVERETVTKVAGIDIPASWIPCPGSPTVTDNDLNVYNTVQIGTQCWMASNLNVGTRLESNVAASNNSTIEKYCYDNNTSNCSTYGGLYDWNEMMQYSTTAGVRGICPEGWHIPTDAEWCTLIHSLDNSVSCPGGSTTAGGKLKETGLDHWNDPNTGATNSSGFKARGAGFMDQNGLFYRKNEISFFWSSSFRVSGYDAYCYYLEYNNMSASRGSNLMTLKFPVRCLKNNIPD